MLRTVAFGACLALGTSAALAQGEFDFDRIPGVPAQPTVEVDLNDALLGFAAAVLRSDDPETAEMIDALQSLRVRVYETVDDPEAVAAFVDRASEALERDGWHRVVFVQDGEERVRVYSRLGGQQLEGLTVLVLDSEEAVFVNIVGPIEPEQLGRVTGAIGLDDVLGGVTARRSDRDWRDDHRDDDQHQQ